MSEKATNDRFQEKEQNTGINRRNYLKLASMAGSGLGTGLGANALSTEFITPAQAATTIIDDFEDGDLSEYDADSDRPGQGSIVSSPTYNGSYALAMSDESTEMISTSGLDNYPSAGDTFSFWVHAAGGADNLNVTWGVQSHDSRYYAKLKPASGEFHLFKYKNESGDYRDGDTSLSLSQDTWYEIEIDWESGGIQTVILYNSSGSQLSQLSMSDSEWSSGGVGYDAYLSSGESVYFDYVTETALTKWENRADHSIVEDFERTDLSNDYTFDRGNPEGATLIRDSDYSGSNPLGATYSARKSLQLSNYNVEMTRQPSDGLTNYPSPGTTSSCWMMASSGADRLNLSYGVTDPENRYFVRVNFVEDRFLLVKYKNGDSTVLASDNTGYTLSQDTWYWVEIHWQSDGTHTVELYDRNDNTLAEASASGDSDLESGRGIGFDAYLENVDGAIIFDGFILGEQDPQEAGWGVYNLCDYISNDEDGDEIYYCWDFKYSLGHPGMRGPFTTTVNGGEVEYYEYDFPLASAFHTYKIDHQSYDTDPDPSDVTAYSIQDKTVFSADVQNTATSGFDYFDLNLSQTKTFFLKPSSYRNWVDNNWGQKASRDEMKEKHIREQGDDLLWEAVFTVLGGAFGYLIAGPIGSLAGTAISGIPLVNELTDEDCGRTITAENTFHKISWDYCYQYPLSGHVTQFTVRVPTGETVEAVVESKLDPGTSYPADNTGRWRVEITGGQKETTLLATEPKCNR